MNKRNPLRSYNGTFRLPNPLAKELRKRLIDLDISLSDWIAEKAEEEVRKGGVIPFEVKDEDR